ncbi:hypothetical protein [Methanosarcina virus MetMV]|jgi:hypothetical protein|nr:hypothetical protein [Methanosarcina virus MetMV]
MKLEDAIYCPKCKEMFNQIEHGHGHRCPFCGNQCPSILDILLVLNTADILHKGKFGFGIVNRVIIITLLVLASWGIVFAAFYGAIKIIELVF